MQDEPLTVRKYAALFPVSDEQLHTADLDHRCDPSCPQWRPPPTKRQRLKWKLDHARYVLTHLHQYRIVHQSRIEE